MTEPMSFQRRLFERLTFSLVLLCVPGSLPAGQALLRAAAETNVNQRYTIESVAIAGVRVENAKLPSPLRHRLTALVGARCDVVMIEDLAAELRRQLHLRAVNERLSRGSEPDRIRVNFELVKREIGFDLSVPKLLYHSIQGWTGELEASTLFHEHHTLKAVAVSNGDDLTERYTGVSARYEDSRVGSDKMRFGLGFESYREKWSDQTLSAAPADLNLYRTRRNIAPEVTFAVAKTLTVSAGVSFEQIDAQSANAVTADVHYGRTFEEQTFDARYSLRAGIRGLGSDFSYSRQAITVRYELNAGHQKFSDEFAAGAINGEAPSFERFVLGSSSTLRGWDRYAINPLGGDRAVHNTLSWGHRLGEGMAETFYDTGALWQTGRSAPIRHSLGAGYRQGIFVLTMAFPVTQGRVTPVFMAGMNY